MPIDEPWAGWYPDPYVPELERWWDGTAWSDATRPPAVAGPGAQHGSMAYGQEALPGYGSLSHESLPQQAVLAGQAWPPDQVWPAQPLPPDGAFPGQPLPPDQTPPHQMLPGQPLLADETLPGQAPPAGWERGGQPGQHRGAHRAHQPVARDGGRLSRGQKAALAGVGAAVAVAIVGGVAFALTSGGTAASRAAAPPASAPARTRPAASAPAATAAGSHPTASRADVTACQQVSSAMDTYGAISHRTEADVRQLVGSLQGAERAAASGGKIRADLSRLVADFGRADYRPTGSDAATLARDCTYLTG